MEPVEIIVIIASVAVVLGVVAMVIYRKIKGKKSGCGSSCCGCRYNASCGKEPTEKK